ncbi:MAG: hypothetical protein N3E51_04925 [Candidatus Micrarchaeota archaeon]|nr:hypothetical protein [Candidatus Micrarchaeota archaeon]
MKGQGATEYLVLLAVVLVIALVVIALLLFFPGMSGPVSESESKIYWTGTAKPFRVHEAEYMPVGTRGICCPYSYGVGFQFVLENSDPDIITLTGVNIDGVSRQFCAHGEYAPGSSIFFGPAEKKSVDVRVQCGEGPVPDYCTRGQEVNVELIFNYNTRYMQNVTQKGTKKFAFRC